MKYVYEPKRKAKHRLRLLLSWENEMNESYGAELEVRPNPEREGGPAVSIFVIIDPATEKGKNIRWITLDNIYFEAYKMDKMSIQNFYKHWIEYIARKNYCSEIFRNKFRITN